MNGIILAVIGQAVIGLSIVIDKLFLKERDSSNVFAYVFWIGVLNFFSIFLLPFGFIWPTINVILIALLAGAVFIASLVCYYFAIQRGEVSNSAALFGGFAPLATLIAGNILILTSLNNPEKIAFGLMTIGGFILFLTDRINFKKIIGWVLLASLGFGLTNVLEKYLYNQTNFLTGFALMKFAVFLATLVFLLVPLWRKPILEKTKSASFKHRGVYLANRILAGVGSVLLSYAISLEHPALVEATNGLRYVVIFIMAIFFSVYLPKLLRENCSRWVLIGKILAIILILWGSTNLFLQRYYQNQPLPSAQTKWGVTFSQKMSQSLNLDWRENYLAILDELRPNGIRLIAYWDLIEKQPGQYDFTDLDWQMREAFKRNIPVILVIGQKVPRWPECHYPQWLDAQNRSLRERYLLEYEKGLIERYKNFPNLSYWQVENESYVIFGECKEGVTRFVDEEISFVRSLNPRKPILLTDGGEWGGWYSVARLGDAFGTTLYRKVYNRYLGQISLYFSPQYYSFKRDMVKKITGKNDQSFIVIELGMEPWSGKQIYEISSQEQIKLFSIEEFKQNIEFARQTRFDEFYLWGAEWWYSLKKSNHPEYWLEAQRLMNQN